jgi:hypothetical protein
MGDMSLEIGYVGSSSKKQIGYTAVNSPPTPGPGPVQPRRFAPNVGNVDGGNNRFTGEYNGLQISANKRLGNGIQFRANYTWSRSMDDQSSLGEWRTQDPFNLRDEWARSSWDIRHVFQVAYVIELPFGRGKAYGTDWHGGLDAILGGWAIEGYTRAQTGAPANIRSGRDIANVGRTYQRPDAYCNPNSGPRTAEQWFNTSCLGFPAAFTYGNAGALIAEEEGRFNWDISVLKDFRVTEQHRLQFRAEFFNAWNHVAFQLPRENTLTSSSFGRISSATASRQIQLALRYLF